MLLLELLTQTQPTAGATLFDSRVSTRGWLPEVKMIWKEKLKSSNDSLLCVKGVKKGEAGKSTPREGVHWQLKDWGGRRLNRVGNEANDWLDACQRTSEMACLDFRTGWLVALCYARSVALRPQSGATLAWTVGSCRPLAR